MSRILDISSRVVLGSVLAIAVSVAPARAAASFRVIYSFQGGRDGGGPVAGLVDDNLGNLYGTTSVGGRRCRDRGCGVVFKITPDGSESVLYAFTGQGDGAEPQATLLRGSDGTLYGTTFFAGEDCRNKGCGTVFSIEPGGRETTLFRFDRHTTGERPYGTLIMDGSGNLFGTTSFAGPGGFGTAFKLAPDGTETVLHAFDNQLDGGFIDSGLLLDRQGNLYGTSITGGTSDSGNVYEIAADGTFSLVHSFTGHDGFGSNASLIRDKAGNLYGAAFRGGTAANGGTVFEIAPDGTATVLYDFSGGSDGQFPNSPLTVDDAGNFYGTTLEGGDFGLGTVYKLSPGGTETVLHSFTGGSDGALPFGGVIARRGRLYGTTWEGGADPTACGNVGCGTVYEVRE